MIVWGGMGPAGVSLGTGGRYDPVNDSWTPVSTTGAPLDRTAFASVWTGSEMIVWGGLSNTLVAQGSSWMQTNTGGRYDPATDTWTPVTPTDAPTARSNLSAVWTGQRMIVWGGSAIVLAVPGGASDTNTGAAYDPAADAWSPLSLTNAPAARSRHAAFWTGDEMLVWGGMEGTPDGETAKPGGRYDPALDVWTLMSTEQSPAGRFNFASGWVNGSMIVWGGNLGNGYSNSGALYDPALDAWTPLSDENAPQARDLVPGCATDTEFFVWGGQSDAPPTARRTAAGEKLVACVGLPPLDTLLLNRTAGAQGTYHLGTGRVLDPSAVSSRNGAGGGCGGLGLEVILVALLLTARRRS